MAGLGLGAIAALPGGHGLLTWVVTSVPGAGLLRDGQKFAVLWVLLLTVATAVVVDRLHERRLPVVALVVAVVWPVATLPTLAWGHSGTWGSVDYPDDVRAVAADLRAEGEPVAVFPWSTYRRYAWADDRVVLDPWNRLLPQPVVADRVRARGAEACAAPSTPPRTPPDAPIRLRAAWRVTIRPNSLMRPVRTMPPETMNIAAISCGSEDRASHVKT